MGKKAGALNSQRIEKLENDMWYMDRRMERWEKALKYSISGSVYIEALYKSAVVEGAGGWKVVKNGFQNALQHDLCDALGLPFPLPPPMLCMLNLPISAKF